MIDNIQHDLLSLYPHKLEALYLIVYVDIHIYASCIMHYAYYSLYIKKRKQNIKNVTYLTHREPYDRVTNFILFLTQKLRLIF